MTFAEMNMRTSTFLATLALVVLMPATLFAEEGEADPQRQFERGFYKEQAERDLVGAIEAYRKVVEKYRATRTLAAKAWLRIALCQEKLGNTAEAKAAFGTVLGEFADQSREVEAARAGLKRLTGAGTTPSLKPAASAPRAKPKGAAEVLKNKTVTLDFMDTPLSDVISFLRDITLVSMVIDPAVLKAADEDELRVQLRVNEIPADQALNLILNMRGLAWKVLHGVVYISRPQDLARYRSQSWAGADPEYASRRNTLMALMNGSITHTFENATLRELLFEFFKATKVQFGPVSEHREELKAKSISYAFEGLSVYEALRAICGHENMEFRIRNGIVILYPKGKAPAETAGQVEIQAQLLQRKMSVDFEETPLTSVLEFIRQVSGLNIILEPAAQKRAAENPITLAVNETSLENVLRLALMPLGMIYAIDRGVVRIQVHSESMQWYESRFGGKRNLRASGGGRHTESAVLMGLIWLKNHQSEDGKWSCREFGKECKKGTCTGAGAKAEYDLGLTGLSLLAFLGAGHTTERGKFKETVKRAIRAVLWEQTPDGCFGKKGGAGHWIYNHAVCTMALCEALGMSRERGFLETPCQKAVDFLVGCQNPGMGWRYGVKPGDNDTSCTAWAVCALKAAKIAGLRIPPGSFQGALNWLDKVTDEAYYKTGYTAKGDSGARLADARGFPPQEAMTAAAVFCRLLMGEYRRSPKVLGGGAIIKSRLPKWDVGAGLVDMYYWYFGTLAMYQLGGRYWKAWNPCVRNALIPTQRRRGCENGSWDPVGAWGKAGGRVYSTAICVLILEVYYRYARTEKGK
jgi:hypothetical protein